MMSIIHRRLGITILTAVMVTGCRPVQSLPRQFPSPAPSPESTPTSQPAPSPSITVVPTPTPQPTPQPSIAVWNINQLWENRSTLVNQTLTIVDVVSHESRCPDVVGARDEQCTTMVWLGETGRHPFPVYQGGEWVQCQGRPDECNGWRKGETYQVIATVRQKQLNSGTALDSYYLDVVIISRR